MRYMESCNIIVIYWNLKVFADDKVYIKLIYIAFLIWYNVRDWIKLGGNINDREE